MVSVCGMYFGSVRFFKQLIIILDILLILGLATSTIFLAVTNGNYKARILDMQSDISLETQSNSIMANHQSSLSFDYQKLYPDMYVELPKEETAEQHTVYLTFDDGPSDRTVEILDILKKENIKATFFILGKDGDKRKDLLKRMAEEGHTIGVHTYTHEYSSIYSSVENYLEDFYKTYQLIYETTGKKPDIFRFPGGSINNYNMLYYEEIIAETARRGFTYYDWNASCGDASAKGNASSAYNDAVHTSEGKNRIILLMHDSHSKSNTVAALSEIIEYYNANEFKFKPLTNEVRPVTFNYVFDE